MARPELADLVAADLVAADLVAADLVAADLVAADLVADLVAADLVADQADQAPRTARRGPPTPGPGPQKTGRAQAAPALARFHTLGFT